MLHVRARSVLRVTTIAALAAISPLSVGTARGGEPAFEWPQFGGGADRNSWRERPDGIRVPHVRWFVPDMHGQPVLGHGALYAAGKGVARIDPSSGKVLARYAPPPVEGKEVAFGGAPVLAPDRVVVRTWDGRVMALRTDLSRVVWSREGVGGPGAAPHPAAFADGLYVVAAGRDVEAANVKDGTSAWRVMIDGPTDDAPAIHGSRVFLGTRDGSVVALDLKTGKRAWKQEGRAEFGWSYPVVAFGKLLLADRGIRGERGGALNAYDLADGHLLWSTDFGATGFSLPGVGRERILGGFGRTVAQFDPATGSMEGARQFRGGVNPFGTPTQVGDTILFGDLDGHLYAFDAKTGTLRWAFRMPFMPRAEGSDEAPARAQVGDFVHAGDRIYVSTQLGLIALDQDPARAEAPEGCLVDWKAP